MDTYAGRPSLPLPLTGCSPKTKYQSLIYFGNDPLYWGRFSKMLLRFEKKNSDFNYYELNSNNLNGILTAVSHFLKCLQS